MFILSQFGYEYGLCSYVGVKVESADKIPKLDKSKFSSEPYILRLATLSDLPLLNRLSSREARHANAQIGRHYTPEFWQYVVHDLFKIKTSRFDGDRDVQIIVETKTGKEVGYTMTSNAFASTKLHAMALDEVEAKYSDVTYPVMRQLFELLKRRKAEERRNQPTLPGATTMVTKGISDPLSICLHDKHPLVVLLGNKANHEPEEHNAGFRLYTRISNYGQFIMTVAPELESRLASSALAGLTGRLRLDFFRSIEGCSAKGLEVFFDNGKITDARDWTNPGPEGLLKERMEWKTKGEIPPTIYSGGFPPLLFTMLLTGRHSLKDLYVMHGDVEVEGGENRLLLNTLFPKCDHHLDLFCW